MFSTTRDVPRPLLMSEGSPSPAGPMGVTGFLEEYGALLKSELLSPHQGKLLF